MKTINFLLDSANIPTELREIAEKVISGKRIDYQEGITLFEKGELNFLGILADFVKNKFHGKNVYFNQNIHLEVTNICRYKCVFCSFSRSYRDLDSWEMSEEEILERVKNFQHSQITEIHITGGVSAKYSLDFWCNLLPKIKNLLPQIHLKAFSAVELFEMFLNAQLSIYQGLTRLKNSGLDSIPGGGAEIFNEKIRKEICSEKIDAEKWLEIHETAHQIGILSNATMLYGHIENYEHRIEHLEKLRNLQDLSQGFLAFIPLKYRGKNNSLSEKVGEVSIIEDMKNYAISRIYLDNFPHLKGYWAMSGKEAAKTSLHFGVDDLDGTLQNSTKIYSMAGVEFENQKVEMSVLELKKMILDDGFIPVERNSLYQKIEK